MLIIGEKMETKDAMLLNPLQLAYAGDAVWEILVRQKLILQHLNVHNMHMECIRNVNAKAQACYLLKIRSLLNDQELSIVQRGRNAHSKHPVPKNQDPADYADATAFEALIGYLYLTEQLDRLGFIYNEILGKEMKHAREEKPES